MQLRKFFVVPYFGQFQIYEQVRGGARAVGKPHDTKAEARLALDMLRAKVEGKTNA